MAYLLEQGFQELPQIVRHIKLAAFLLDQRSKRCRAVVEDDAIFVVGKHFLEEPSAFGKFLLDEVEPYRLMREKDDLPVGEFLLQKAEQAAAVANVEAGHDVVQNHEARVSIEDARIREKQDDTQAIEVAFAEVRETLAAIRQQERDSVYQRYLFAPDAKVDVSFDEAFAFTDGMYWDQRRYRGRWKPRKHFLGPDHVPAFDGAENGEEFQCAQAIDSLPDVTFWIRNVARHPNSFWLPTATDKFYPDFVAQLEDGRLLVVEYKGAHIAEGPDTAEKRTIGRLWEEKSGGKGLFAIVEMAVDGKDMRAQLVEKVGG